MNWRQGLFRVWLVLSAVWLFSVLYLASDIFLKPYPFAGDYQYQIQTKTMPWDTDWKKPLYDIINAPGKGKFPDQFSVIEAQYIDGFNKSVKDGNDIKIEFPDMSRLIISSQFTLTDRDYLSKIFWDQRWSRYFWRIVPWGCWAFGPPVALLCIGFVILWIRRGFLPTKSI